MEIIGHRGACGLAPENTIKSFKKAIKLGVDGIETDLQLTKDKKIVLFHDKNTKRVSSKNKVINKSTLKELKDLKIGIPTLKEALELSNKITWHLEIKDSQVILELRKILKNRKNIVFSSFKMLDCVKLKKLFPKIECAYLARSFDKKTLNILEKNNIKTIHLKIKYITSKNIELLKRKGIKIRAWSTNNPATVKKLIKLGINKFFTDRPDIINHKTL